MRLTDENNTGAAGDSRQPESTLERDQRETVAKADEGLRGKDIAPQAMYDLATRLRKANKFGHARRLYARLWSRGEWGDLKVTAVRVGQFHALATYKDPDLPAGYRFKRALEILDEVDQFDFAKPPSAGKRKTDEELKRLPTEQRQESLGLRGAVYKRRWQVEGQRADLERALAFYLKGYRLGQAHGEGHSAFETDWGYTGINAAFVLDLLAREDAEESQVAGVESELARRRINAAREIRRELVAQLPVLASKVEWLSKEWWFAATLAEAHIGLGQFTKTVDALKAYNHAHELPHEGPPLDDPPPTCVPRWEFESTLTQLTALGGLQAAQAALLDLDPLPEADLPSAGAAAWEEHGKKLLREYLGDFAPSLDRFETGKLGLALSGGGFRASFFHIGVLAYLAERDMLRRIEVMSCVSGGSIVGAYYYLELQRLLETKPDSHVNMEDYLDIVERLEKGFLAGVETNIRGQVFGSIWANLRTFFQPGYTTTRRLGRLYERELYARVRDQRHDRPRLLRDLLVKPAGERETFQPKYDNWTRRAKVPMLVLNATTLNTGHNWQFTASWMGEPPLGLGAEIEGNYELRRMYHWEAPRLRDRWRHWYTRPFAPPDYRQMRLGDAVAASSCVPGLFEPLVLADLYDGKVVRLVDGGVHDNQGMASLIEQDCNVMIVSDASGQMDAQDHPSAGRLGVSLRSFSVSMTRVRDAQYKELAARARTGLLKGLMFLHLKRDLDSAPVDWRDCEDPYDAADDGRPAARRGVLTQYGIHKSVQRLLSALRTDLDSFTELEAFALMTSGYQQAESQFACLPDAGIAKGVKRQWRFQQVAPLLDPGERFEEVHRQLRIGAQTGFKAWRLSRALQAVAGLLLLAAGFGLFRLWQANRDLPVLLDLGTVTQLATGAGILIASLLAPQIVALVRYRQTLRGFGVKSIIATVLALAFKVHVLAFDPIFLWFGRVKRLLPKSSSD